MSKLLDKIREEIKDENTVDETVKKKKRYGTGNGIYANASKPCDVRTIEGRNQVLANMGVDMSSFGIYADKEVLANRIERLERNANEVMNTGATGYGAELVPTDVLMAEVMDALPKYQRFVQALPGFHGAGLDKTVTKSIKGDAGLMNLVAETTTGALAVEQGTNRLGTDKITLNQKKYAATIDVSDELSTFSNMTPESFEAMIRDTIASSWARTEEALIINGDTETGATGNVNSDDGAPSSSSYYLGADGLRKTAIVTDTNTVDVGAFAWADIVSMINGIGDYAATPEECMWLFNRATYNKTLTLDEFKKANENGSKSIIFDGALSNILGSDLFVARDLGKTEADGKISTTAASNTLGQLLYFWKPAVQWGFGRELRLKLHDFGSKGFQLDGWGYIGLAIVGNGQTANLENNTVCAGINVTVV